MLTKTTITFYSIWALCVLGTSCSEPKTTEQTTQVQGTDSDTITSVHKTTERLTTPPKVFYYDYTEKRGTEDAIDMSQDDALAALKSLPEEDGNYFGMELSDGSVVQFMYDGNKSGWFLDIPDPKTQESYNADVTMDDAVNIIGDVYGGKSADDIQAAYH